MKKILAFILIGSALVSCRKEEVGVTEGPNLTDIYGTFSVVTALAPSQPTVDFAAGETVYFTAETSKLTDWKLTITGQTSGAEKIIEGVGTMLSQSDAIWDGSTTNFPMFQAEVCDVSLTFDGETDTLTTTVTVGAAKVNQGFVLADFETGYLSGWTNFIQSGGNMDFNIKTDATSPQEGSYINMQGTVNWDWLIGLLDFNATAYNETTLPLSDNASNLYFNALVYGEAGLSNSLVLFRFDEDENEDGTFDGASEDQFQKEIPIDWVGWRLISIRYDELDGGGTGDGAFDPDKLNKVSVLHLANPSSGFAKSGLDYMIFTENGPLQP